MIDGNVNAYEYIINSKELVERVMDYNMLNAGIGEVTEENVEEKRS